MTSFHENEAKKKFKLADSKKGHFSKSPILDIFLWKFNGLVLGLVGLNDAKGIDVAYVGQPHGHIGWAKSMPFTSFNPTNPRTNPLNFHKKYQELAILKNDLFFSRPFWIFFSRKNFFFCFIPMKTSQSLLVSKDGSKFWWLPWIPAKNHSPQTFQPAV